MFNNSTLLLMTGSVLHLLMKFYASVQESHMWSKTGKSNQSLGSICLNVFLEFLSKKVPPLSAIQLYCCFFFLLFSDIYDNNKTTVIPSHLFIQFRIFVYTSILKCFGNRTYKITQNFHSKLGYKYIYIICTSTYNMTMIDVDFYILH